MLNESRTYRNSSAQFVFVVLIFGVIGLAFFAILDHASYFILIPFGILLAIIFGFSLYYMTTTTTISDTEISTQNLLGTKSLGWSEINRASGSGYKIKLHNFDGDVTVSPNPQLPGYEEVVEWIGVKRPDLFNPQVYNELTKNWTNTILSVIAVLFVVGFGTLSVLDSNQWFMAVFFAIIGLVIIGVAFSSPQSIKIEGRSLLIKYLFSQITLSADEIRSIELKYQRTRNGKTYYVALNLTTDKSVHISGLKPNLPIVYLTLKNWHKNYNKTNQSYFANN